MRQLIKPTVTLALICSISAGALGYTHATTTRVIEERRQKEFRQAIQSLLPEATHFEEVRGEDVHHHILASRDSERVGAIVPVSAKGYGGEMVILVAFNSGGSVHDVTIFSHGETAGIGDRVLDRGFLSQFVNKTAQDKFAIGGDVHAIGGATVSSRAVISGVKTATLAYQEHVGGEAPVDEPFDLAQVQDGVYQGSAEGFKSTVAVEVTVAGGKIIDAKITAIDDTPEVADEAVKEIAKRIIAQQDWQVDAVSGATYSSEGVMNAVKAALAGAGVSAAVSFDQVQDGEYIGEAEGFGGPLSLKITIEGGKLTKVEIVSHDDTPGVSDAALNDMPKAMIEKQTVEVDAVSGATYTSQGIIDAVKQALKGAPSR